MLILQKTCTLTYLFHFTGHMYFFLQHSALFVNSQKKAFCSTTVLSLQDSALQFPMDWSGFIVMLAFCHYITVMNLFIQGKWKIKKGGKKCRSVVMCSGQLVSAFPCSSVSVSTSPHKHTGSGQFHTLLAICCLN